MSSEQGTNKLLHVVATFCGWSGMRVNLRKTFVTAYDFRHNQPLPTDNIRYQGAPLRHLPARESFPYLGVRAALVGKRGRPSPCVRDQKAKVRTETVGLKEVAAAASTLSPTQLVPAMRMIAVGKFAYSAGLVPWSDSELDDLHKCWLQVERAAWTLPRGYPSAPLTLPEGAVCVPHPRIAYIQALSTHVEQLVALPDEIRERAVVAYKLLCTKCGCANERELAAFLVAETKPRACAIARLIRASGQLGTNILLPRALTESVCSREVSWQALRTCLRTRVAGGPLAEDFAIVEGVWAGMIKRLRKRGLKYPSQLILGAREEHPTCLLPAALPRNPKWLSPLRRILTKLDLRDLFPRVDRGAKPAPVAVHQELVHQVLSTLRSPPSFHRAAKLESLFRDGRWDRIRSSALRARWRAELLRVGVRLETAPEDARPVRELIAVALAERCSAPVLLRLVLWIAPTLSTRADHTESEMERDRRDTWSPVRLTREGVELVVQAEGDGLRERMLCRGQVKAVTKDGLVRVVDGEGHVGTVAQGRWGLLCAAKGEDVVAERLRGLIRDTEREEASRGVPSLQLWTGLVKNFQIECVSGSSLLVAPSCAPGIIRRWDSADGWGPLPQPGARMLHNTLTLSPSDQTNLLSALTPDGPWVCLTRASSAIPALQERLGKVGIHVHTFKRGSLIVASRGNWRKGKLTTARSSEEWSVVMSKALALSQEEIARARVAVKNITLTKDGVVPLDPSCPSFREAQLGPCGSALTSAGLIMATDGSVREDGAMGAAMVCMGNQVPSRSVAVSGPPSSPRAELTGILLALEEAAESASVTILTDSLVSIQWLKAAQRLDWPLWMRGIAERQLLRAVIHKLNRRSEQSGSTRIVKVRAHAAQLLNEAADISAAEAAELQPSEVDPRAISPAVVRFYVRDAPLEWGAPVRRHLAQVASAQAVEKLRQKQDLPKTARWLLRPHQGRQFLAEEMTRLRYTARKRRLLQAIAGSFPTQAVLFQWGIAHSPACRLCGAQSETLAHVQCWCPALKERRIRAHHALVSTLFRAIPESWQVHQEMSVANLLAVPTPLHLRDVWQRMVDEFEDSELEGSGDGEGLDSMLRKRPDGFAISWSQQKVCILEFTRAYDASEDWAEVTDERKRRRYAPLQEKMGRCLPPPWQVDTLLFTVGVRGSLAEITWQAALSRLGFDEGQVSRLERSLISQALAEFDGLLGTWRSALNTMAGTGGHAQR